METQYPTPTQFSIPSSHLLKCSLDWTETKWSKGPLNAEWLGRAVHGVAEVSEDTYNPYLGFPMHQSELIWFAAPSGLYTFPPIHHCVFFHYPRLKTDTLTYGHVGLGKVSEPEAHHSWSPRWEQQSRLVRGGGLSPVLDAQPEWTGLLTHPHARLRGCCHRGSLGR